MKKAIKTSLLAALTLCISNASADLSFQQTIFFGDSLTDSGAFAGNPDAGNGGSFTTDPGNIWAETLASYLGTTALANNPNNPNSDPAGTNYAQGGAQVNTPIGIGSTPSPQSAQPISTQINTYLTSTGGVANPNALYTVWGGANDVFYNMTLVGSGLPISDALSNIGNSANQLAGIVQQLADAGANTIIVPNLPDTGTTPSSVLSTINTAGAGNPKLGDALTAAVTALAQVGTGQELNALSAAEQALGLPTGSLTPAYQQLSTLSSTLSQSYNAVLAQTLAEVDANIITLDTVRLFNEIRANPTEFFLGNTTGVACITPSALACTTDTVIDPVTPNVFLFADSVHPTTAGHQIFADYAFSVLNAPALAATFAEVPHSMLRRKQNSISSHLQNLPQSQGWSLFGDYTLGKQEVDGAQTGKAETEDNHLLIGTGRRIGNAFTIGAAIEKASSNVDFTARQGSFDLDTTSLSLFAGYHSEMLFADLVATVSVQSDYDIKRMIPFGATNRVETGDTEGDMRAIKFKFGAALVNKDNLNFGPFASIAHQSVDVDSYTENNHCTSGPEAVPCSTTMFFEEQSRDSLLAEAGLFTNIKFPHSQLHAELAYEKELDDDDRSITAGLVSTDSGFTLNGIQPQEDSWNFNLRYQLQASTNARAFLGYRLRKGENNDDQSFSIGVQLDF